MNTIDTREMKALDEDAINRFHIPALILMENAGRGIADIVSSHRKNGKVVVCCGKGNNGGDGLVCARHLVNRGYSVTVLLTGKPEDLKAEAAVNMKIVTAMQVPLLVLQNSNKIEEAQRIIRDSDVVVDALLGIGVREPVRSPVKELIEAMNAAQNFKVAVDIPSGLDSDTGEIHGCAVRANITGTLGAVKHGLNRGNGPACCGEVQLLDISLPASILPLRTGLMSLDSPGAF